MTDHTREDLIERLRDHGDSHHNYCDLRNEAADALTALQRKTDTYERANDQAGKDIVRLQTVINDLRAENERLRDNLRAENAKLRIAVLEEAKEAIRVECFERQSVPVIDVLDTLDTLKGEI